MNRVSEFMLQLSKDLIEKKDVTESTASAYVKNLWTLNNKQLFNNLTFLKNTTNIDTILSTYKDNTKKTMLSAVVSVLSLYKDKPSYKKTYLYYHDLMMDKAEEMKNTINVNEKTEKEKNNWIEWDEVLAKKALIKTFVDQFADNKLITPDQFDILLAYVIICLYTCIPPRRNDYIDMYFIVSSDEENDKNKNYLDWTNKKFIFNKYKTFKKYGVQTIDIGSNEELINALSIYLKHHPLNPTPTLKKIPKNTNFKLLVFSDGSPLSAVNAITRVLNRIFDGKKIGSSQLRHIYLSSKYNIKDMKDDSVMMAHSLHEQQSYMKEPTIDIDTEDNVEIPKDIKPVKVTKKNKSNVI